MRGVVFYATRYGNTRRVAEAIADGLRSNGTAEVHSVEDGPSPITDEVDLVAVGGPTEGHGMTPPVLKFLGQLPPLALAGRAAVAFDTRVSWPRWLSGSAAEGIRERLGRAGATAPVGAESFLVSMKPEIGPDELARARAWGATLARLDRPTHQRKSVPEARVRHEGV